MTQESIAGTAPVKDTPFSRHDFPQTWLVFPGTLYDELDLAFLGSSDWLHLFPHACVLDFKRLAFRMTDFNLRFCAMGIFARRERGEGRAWLSVPIISRHVSCWYLLILVKKMNWFLLSLPFTILIPIWDLWPIVTD